MDCAKTGAVVAVEHKDRDEREERRQKLVSSDAETVEMSLTTEDTSLS